jgi:hypothetical protein
MRWLERVAVVIVLLLTAAVLWACWMPAYVGSSDADQQPVRRR